MILLFIFLFAPNVFANEYLSDKTETNYNSNNGLLTGKANTICQTADGYIWIGQYAGLTRSQKEWNDLLVLYTSLYTF